MPRVERSVTLGAKRYEKFKPTNWAEDDDIRQSRCEIRFMVMLYRPLRGLFIFCVTLIPGFRVASPWALCLRPLRGLVDSSDPIGVKEGHGLACLP